MMTTMTMTMVLDLAVLGASAGAVLYCGQLARRLGQLRAAEGGTPKALADLSAAIQASRDSAAQIATSAERATDQLRAAHADLARQRREAEDLSGMLDGQSALAERRLAQAHQAAEAALTGVTRRAGIELEALTRAVEIAALANEGRQPARQTPRPALTQEEPDRATALPSATQTPVRQRAASEPNPFLRAVG